MRFCNLCHEETQRTSGFCVDCVLEVLDDMEERKEEGLVSDAEAMLAEEVLISLCNELESNSVVPVSERRVLRRLDS